MKGKLRKFDIFGLVIGAVIGWGSFMLPGSKFLKESGVLNTTIGLVIGGILIFVIQFAYHIMLEHHVEDGGEFTYTYSNFGEKHGFVVGWSLVLCYLSMIPLNAGALILLLKEVFGNNAQWFYLYTIAGSKVFFSDLLVVSFVIFMFYKINVRGIVFSAKVQNIMSLLLVTIVFVLLGVIALKSDLTVFKENYFLNQNISFSQISSIIAIVPFLFVGFDVVPQVVSDLKFSAKKATMIILVAITIGVCIYASLNLIAALSFSPVEVSTVSFAVAQSIIQKMGYFGFYVMLIALIAAIVGGINGFMIASSKMVVALAKNNILHKKYALVNHNGIFQNAIRFVCLVSVVAPFLGRQMILYIVDLSSLLAAIAYFYVSLISFKYCMHFIQRFLAVLSISVSCLFIALLLFPFSTARLSNMSLILIVVWMVLGGVMYFKRKEKR